METNALEASVQFAEFFYYKDGYLYNLIDRNPRQLKDMVVGSLSQKGYLQFQLHDKFYKVHRVIWTLHHGEIPEGLEIDHKDKNRLNNLISNLRLATTSQNAMNKAKPSTSVGVLKGTTYHAASGKWRAQIQENGKRKHLGTFNSEMEAHLAWKQAATLAHGDFISI